MPWIRELDERLIELSAEGRDRWEAVSTGAGRGGTAMAAGGQMKRADGEELEKEKLCAGSGYTIFRVPLQSEWLFGKE